MGVLAEAEEGHGRFKYTLFVIRDDDDDPMCRMGANAPNVGPPSGTPVMRRESGMASPELPELPGLLPRRLVNVGGP